MKIAVTSQNRHEITGHAGRCRNFWIFDVIEGRVASRTLLELPKQDSLHDTSPDAAHPLDVADVLITGGMGTGLVARLARRGIEAVVTTETDPDRAVSSWLVGVLPIGTPHKHAHGVDGGDEHSPAHDCHCGEPA